MKLGLTLALAAFAIALLWTFAPGPDGKRLGDVTLAQLLEQARPAGINIKKVAARAGVAVGSLYQYFGRRRQLLEVVTQLSVRTVTELFE